MSYRDIAKSQLKVDEGIKSKPYKDTVGKLTIGVGRNLDDVGLHPEEIDLLLDNDLSVAESVAKALFSTFDSLSDARKAVLLNMAFNMGRARLAGFNGLRHAVEVSDFERASAEMLDSVWARQVGERATRLAGQMRTG